MKNEEPPKLGESEASFISRTGFSSVEYLEHIPEMESLALRLGFSNNDNLEYGDFVRPSSSPFPLYYTKKNMERHGLQIEDLYSFNSEGFRSENFSREHDGMHILFGGCSITMGEAMFEDFCWAKDLYRKISSETKVSGYYNIGTPGRGISDILGNTIRYIKKYGSPNVIFLNLPDIERDYNGTNILHAKNMIMALQETLSLICAKENTKLYMFSWDHKINMNVPKDFEKYNGGVDVREFFDNFYKFDFQDGRLRHQFEFKEDGVPEEYHFVIEHALDFLHPGIAEHSFYSNFAYSLYAGDL